MITIPAPLIVVVLGLVFTLAVIYIIARADRW